MDMAPEEAKQVAGLCLHTMVQMEEAKVRGQETEHLLWLTLVDSTVVMGAWFSTMVSFFFNPFLA